jgi:hypothetical protein
MQVPLDNIKFSNLLGEAYLAESGQYPIMRMYHEPAT